MNTTANSIHSDETSQRYFVPPIPAPLKMRTDRVTLLSKLQYAERVINAPLEAFADFHYELPYSQGQNLGVTSTIVNDPKLIRYCMVENASNYGLSVVRQSVLKPLLGEGLLTVENEDWRRSRKMLSPVFSPKYVRSFAEAMRNCCEEYLPKLDGYEEPTPVSPILSEITYLILSATLFSGEINEEADQALQSVSYLLEKSGKPDILDLMHAPSWMPRLSKIRSRAAIPRFRNLVTHTVQNRKKQIAAGEDVPRDFLTLLVEAEDEGQKFSEQELKDNLVTFISAGHETTSRGLTWTLYLLSNSPEFLTRVEEEVDQLDFDETPPEEWMDKLPWCTACFEEAMRIYPPAAVMTRRVIEDDQYEDLHLPKDSQLILAPWILHRHKLLWENPEQFNPERFFGENRKKIDRFAYLPFGAGPRICIGSRFAMQEAVIIMAVFLKHFRFEYASKAPPWPVLRITLQTDNGMPMRITRRK